MSDSTVVRMADDYNGGWQPLSTAPKDGTLIFLRKDAVAGTGNTKPKVWVGWWDRYDETFRWGFLDADGERPEVNGWSESAVDAWQPLNFPEA